MNAIKPEHFANRSFIYRKHDQAEFTEVNGAAQILNYTEQSDPDTGLVDLSVRSRFGLRGPGAENALKVAGLPVPDRPNKLMISDRGVMVLRLGKTEYWLLSLPNETETVDMAGLESQLAGEGVYPVYCQDSHAWLALAGEHLADIMAKICGVDLREEAFPEGAIAQTSLARVGGIICHHRSADLSVFTILSDSASANYLWGAILDAMDEFEGRPAGQNMLLKR